MKLHKHTHPFNGPLSRTTGWADTRKVKPIWILLKQETVSGSGISWAICKSASRSRQTTMPAPHHSVLQAGCPSCRPTNSGKALKANCETAQSKAETLTASRTVVMQAACKMFHGNNVRILKANKNVKCMES